MNGRQVTIEEQKSIATQYTEGVSIERLAYIFHRAPQVIRNAILSQGVQVRKPGGRKFKEEIQCHMAEDYRNGYTLELLGEKYGCAPGTVRNILSDRGVEMRRTGRAACLETSGCSDLDSSYRQKARARLRTRLFGWTHEQFEAAWEQQCGLCAICKSPLKTYGRYNDSVAVDHDHISGKARGLLCQQCNKGLGHFRDSSTLLRLAATYLEDHLHGV